MAGFEEGWGKEMDSKEHLGTYGGFLTGAKLGTIGVVAILILMAIFLL